MDCYCRTNWLDDVVKIQVVKPHDPEEDRPGKPESPIPKFYITNLAEFGREDYTPEMHEQRLKTVRITKRQTAATGKTESTLE